MTLVPNSFATSKIVTVLRGALMFTLAASCALPIVAQPRAEETATGREPLVLRGAIESYAVTPKPGRMPVSARSSLAKGWQPGDPIVEVPRRSYGGTQNVTPPLRDGIDPLAFIQRGSDELRAATRSAPGLSSPILNIEGNTFSGSMPPDPTGAMGLNHYVQAVNGGAGTTIKIFDRAGTALASFSLRSLVQDGDCHDFARGDPVVLYDHLDHRWLLTEFTSLGNNKLCLYISDTEDPTAGWMRYEFDIPTFPDYPKYGVWPDGYYVGSNEQNGPTVIVFDRRKILRGEAATSQRFEADDLNGFVFQMLLPADFDGKLWPAEGTAATFARHNDDEAHSLSPSESSDWIELYDLSVDWDDALNSSFSGPTNVAISEFDSHLCGYTIPFECVPQPGTSIVLDAVREPLMYKLQYRNHGSHESLVGNMVTDVDGTDQHGVRWFELRRTASAWSLYQEGTYSPDDEHRWMGSAAMDADQNIALGYNLSSSTSFAGLYYTGRTASDDLGVMTQGEMTIQAGLGISFGGRFGDYSQMSIDPVDDCTFWFTGEYAGSSNWGTRIASFQFTGCTQELVHLTGWEDGDTNAWTITNTP